MSGAPTVLVRFFGEATDESSVARVERARLRPFAAALGEPLISAGESRVSQAKIDALDWSLRHPEHAAGFAPPLPLPPPKAMALLVGRAIEVLWPDAGAWYKAVVETYDEARGLHFLVYADGDVEVAGAGIGVLAGLH